jgi:hypothetical protein
LAEGRFEHEAATATTFRCTGCRFACAAGEPPLECPRCGGSAWQFHTAHSELEAALRRVRGSLYVLTPEHELDAGMRLTLIEVVAALAHDRPEIVVDLTAVDGDDPADQADVVGRLAAITRGAGGRLLAVHGDGGDGSQLRRLLGLLGDAAP